MLSYLHVALSLHPVELVLGFDKKTISAGTFEMTNSSCLLEFR